MKNVSNLTLTSFIFIHFRFLLLKKNTDNTTTKILSYEQRIIHAKPYKTTVTTEMIKVPAGFVRKSQ